ncbi:MAG: cystathionine gamma-lyase [Chloroflexi bacterium]|nr:cystathionine gamma-lyase [Chloroflexota bacterium]MCC6892017.1 cystathionine gamma-lyase [Anaerolineae bacterium]
MKPATRVVRAGLPAPQQSAPYLPGPTFAAPYHAAGEPSSAPYNYGRLHNPTWTLFEQALAELEGGPTLVFASGMAAIAAVFGATLRPGDKVVLPSDSYYLARVMASGYFTQMGVQVVMSPTANNSQLEQLDGAKLLWLETPSNPNLDVCDIAALVEAAHARGVLVAVDNTTATPLGQQPLALGADFSVASDTKGLTGHSDLILGHVAVREPSLLDGIRMWRNQIGAVPGPMEVWLAHRSLATLHLRLERQCANALAIARYLTTHPAVTDVRYPGLEGHPAHELAARQMRYYGSIVSFTLADAAAAQRFLSASKLIYEATSFGSLHSTAERRARWGGDVVAAGFIRMNVGCEAVEDLLADIEQALP